MVSLVEQRGSDGTEMVLICSQPCDFCTTFYWLTVENRSEQPPFSMRVYISQLSPALVLFLYPFTMEWSREVNS